MKSDQKTLEWEAFLMLIAQRVEEMAKGEENPEELLERLWLDELGMMLGLTHKGVASVVEDLSFQEVLQERHNLHRSDFPIKVGNNPQEEGEPTNLTDWVIGLR